MKKKVLFVIGSLQIGGAETVMVDIVNNINKDFDITILLIEKRGELLERLNSNIDIKYLTLGEKYCSNLFQKLFQKIKRSLIYRFLGKNSLYIKYIYRKLLKKEFNTEVAFLVGLPSDIVKKSPNKESKKIVWIHTSVYKDDKPTYEKYKDVYKYFDETIAVSKDSQKTFETTFPESKGKIKLLYNYVDTKKISAKAEENIDVNYNPDTINLVSLGRLTIEKGYDRIINIAKKYEEKITFYIVGGGALEEQLKADIAEKQLKNVILLGSQPNPYPFVKKADAFLLSSRCEGYPTVVIEAMVLKKSIIATKVAGVQEILERYDNKVLIENTDNALEEGIDQWLQMKKQKNQENKHDFEVYNEEVLNQIKKELE